MENAVDSLYLAFGVMIFVLALSITMSMFTQARESIQAIVSIREEEQSYVTDENGRFINYVNFNGGTRTVGIETIIPMMYRAYKENYMIYFYDSNNAPYELYKDSNDNIINYVDLDQENYDGTEDAIEHLKERLNNGLYSKLQQTKFTEKLGEYYLEDVNSYNSEVAEINKTKKRVIIYIEN